MIKIGVVVLVLLLGAYAEIVNDSGTQFYFTSGLPGKDSSSVEPSGTQLYITAGISGGDSVVAGCDSNITNTLIAVDTTATSFSVSCSVLCGAGRLYLYSSSGAKIDSSTGMSSGARDTLTITGGTPSQEDSVRAIFSDTVNSVLDTSAWISYVYADTGDTANSWEPPAGTLATITGNPINATRRIGQTATFSATATGESPISYQWQLDSTGTYANVSGANSSAYTTGALTMALDSTFWRVIVSNAIGADTSTGALLRVQQRRSVLGTFRNWIGIGF